MQQVSGLLEHPCPEKKRVEDKISRILRYQLVILHGHELMVVMGRGWCLLLFVLVDLCRSTRYTAVPGTLPQEIVYTASRCGAHSLDPE